VERLREFWELITSRPVWPCTPDGDEARKARNVWSAFLTLSFGQPGFFSVNVPGPLLSPRGSHQATSFYDSAPLRETLMRLVDFDLINSGNMRFAVGTVNVADGNFFYFDNADTEIIPEHVMASGALPPGLPMVRIGTDCYWDGGLVSNTPLQHLLDNVDSGNMLVFQVDLFSARGPIPRDMQDVLAREKDIRYSSRTRLNTDYHTQLHRMKLQLRALLKRLPDAELTLEDRATKAQLARLPEIAIIHLIYQQAAYEIESKDYEFSASSMREHWTIGYEDTVCTLRHPEWLRVPDPDGGIVEHDVHRVDD
jgi:NTE family protein